MNEIVYTLEDDDVARLMDVQGSIFSEPDFPKNYIFAEMFEHRSQSLITSFNRGI
jgi:hypothetical protein